MYTCIDYTLYDTVYSERIIHMHVHPCPPPPPPQQKIPLAPTCKITFDLS